MFLWKKKKRKKTTVSVAYKAGYDFIETGREMFDNNHENTIKF